MTELLLFATSGILGGLLLANSLMKWLTVRREQRVWRELQTAGRLPDKAFEHPGPLRPIPIRYDE